MPVEVANEPVGADPELKEDPDGIAELEVPLNLPVHEEEKEEAARADELVPENLSVLLVVPPPSDEGPRHA